MTAKKTKRCRVGSAGPLLSVHGLQPKDMYALSYHTYADVAIDFANKKEISTRFFDACLQSCKVGKQSTIPSGSRLGKILAGTIPIKLPTIVKRYMAKRRKNAAEPQKKEKEAAVH